MLLQKMPTLSLGHLPVQANLHWHEIASTALKTGLTLHSKVWPSEHTIINPDEDYLMEVVLKRI